MAIDTGDDFLAGQTFIFFEDVVDVAFIDASLFKIFAVFFMRQETVGTGNPS